MISLLNHEMHSTHGWWNVLFSHIGLHLETVERPWSYYDLQGVISDHHYYFNPLLEQIVMKTKIQLNSLMLHWIDHLFHSFHLFVCATAIT